MAGMRQRNVSTKKILPAVTISDNESEIFVVRWSPDGKYVAAGAGDGSISIFDSVTGGITVTDPTFLKIYLYGR